MADERQRTKSELKHLFTNLKNKGISEDMIGILIDVLWRDRVTQRTSGFDYAGSYDSQISFDTATRIFTIKPFDPLVAGFVPRFGIFSWVNLAVYHRIYDTLTLQIPNEEGLFCIYFDKEPDPGRNQVLTLIKNPTTAQLQVLYISKIIISFIYWDAENGELIHFGDDRHGSEWNPQIHWYLHKAFAARRQSGLEFTNMIVDGDGSVDAHAQFKISAGIILHDDFELSIPASLNTIPILYFSTGNVPRYAVMSDFGILQGTNLICFNNNQQELLECTSGNFCMYHLFAVNEIEDPELVTISRKIISVMGTNQYDAIGPVYAALDSELDRIYALMPQQGRCYLGSIIVQTDISYSNAIKARIVRVLKPDFHPPVSIHADSMAILEIDEFQVLKINTDDLGGGGIAEVITDLSVTGNGTAITPIVLVNDENTPGADQYYGTNNGGVKGYHSFPAAILVDQGFEYCVDGGVAQIETIDLYASSNFVIDKLVAECDGTLTNITVKINSVSVAGLSAVSVNTLVVFTATAANTVVLGDRITIEIGTGYSGTPTIIKGKLIIKA